jgi:hypothetical protein
LTNIAKLVTLQLLQAYKRSISPMLPAACRYVPTCSEYAMEAVERYGALRGEWMALARILRCHPFAGYGYDPVVRPGHGAGDSYQAMRPEPALSAVEGHAARTISARTGFSPRGI